MADIRISTQVEGLQQALSDIQTLRSQLEALGSLQVAGGVGGGGTAGGGAGIGNAGSSGAQVAQIPPPTNGQNNAGNGTGSITTTSLGLPPQTNAQDTIDAAQRASQEADRYQQHFRNQTSQQMMAIGYGVGSAGGFGGEIAALGAAGGLIQEIRQSNVHLAEMRMHMQNSSNQASLLKSQIEEGVKQGTFNIGSTKYGQLVDEQFAAQQAAAGLQGQIGALQGSQNMAILGVGAQAIIGAAQAGGYIGSTAMRQRMALLAPEMRLDAMLTNRERFGIQVSAEERYAAGIEAQFGREEAKLEAAAQTVQFKVADFLSGGTLSTEHELKKMRLRRQQQREETFFEESISPTFELERLFADSSLAGEDYRQGLYDDRFRRDASGRPVRRNEYIANRVLGMMGQEIGLGAESMVGTFRGTNLTNIDRLTPDERNRALASIGASAYMNRIGGGLQNQTSALLGSALASLDFDRIREYAAVSAGLKGPAGSTAADDEYLRIQQLQDELVKMNFNVQMGLAERQKFQAEVGFVRAGGLGRGADSDTAIIRALGAIPGTFNAQIQQLEQQVKATQGMPVEQRQYEAMLMEVKANQLRARDAQFDAYENIQKQREALARSEVSLGITQSMVFGSMEDRETSIRAQVGTQEMSVERVQGRLMNMYMGKESYTMEKERMLQTSLNQELEKLTRTTMEAEKAVYGLQYSFQSAEKAILSAESNIKTIQGYGGISIAGDMLAVQRTNLATVASAESEVSRLRSMGVSENSQQMMEAKQRLSAARVSVAQMPQQILSTPFTAAASEAVAESQFTIQMLNQLPGGFGLRRQALTQGFNALGTERAELDQLLEAAREAGGGEVSPGTMSVYNQRRRAILQQQVGLIGELSYGWQNRLLSTISGAPDMSAITPMLSNRAVIGAGIRNPFFGSNRSDLEESIESSLLIGTMAGAQTPAGMALGAFTRMPTTISVRGNPLSNPFEGAKLDVTINGLPGTGVLRPNTGGSAFLTNLALYNNLTNRKDLA